MADAAKPKRRLPFKPTALRQKSDPKPATQKNDNEEDDDDDGLNLFQRSAEFFPVAVAEQERRMKRKQAEREKSSQARSPERETEPAPRASEEPGKTDVEEDTRYAPNAHLHYRLGFLLTPFSQLLGTPARRHQNARGPATNPRNREQSSRRTSAAKAQRHPRSA